jgi:hypothetical protein
LFFAETAIMAEYEAGEIVSELRLLHGQYAQIPEELLTSKAPPAAVMVYASLELRAGKKRQSWPSIRTLGGDLGLSTSTVSKAISWLIDAGFIVRERRYADNGSQLSSIYNLPVRVGKVGKVGKVGISDAPPKNDTPPVAETDTPPVAKTAFTPVAKTDTETEKGRNKENNSSSAAVKKTADWRIANLRDYFFEKLQQHTKLDKPEYPWARAAGFFAERLKKGDDLPYLQGLIDYFFSDYIRERSAGNFAHFQGKFNAVAIGYAEDWANEDKE